MVRSKRILPPPPMLNQRRKDDRDKEEEEEEEEIQDHYNRNDNNNDSQDEDSSETDSDSESEDDDDDLILEGVLVRNTNVLSSSDDDNDEDEDEENENEDENENENNKENKSEKSKNSNEEEEEEEDTEHTEVSTEEEEEEEISEETTDPDNDNDSYPNAPIRKKQKSSSFTVQHPVASSVSVVSISVPTSQRRQTTTTNDMEIHSNPKKDIKNQKTKNKDKRKKKDSKEIDMIHVEFTFHDMDEKFFHGIKMLLHSVPIYTHISSQLANHMIDNIIIGTIVSCDDGGDNVYGFASVLGLHSLSKSHSQSLPQSQSHIQHLVQTCTNACPKEYTRKFHQILSTFYKTTIPKQKQQHPPLQLLHSVGFLLHGRMVNLPLEITLVLHEQLALDLDWASQHLPEKKNKDLEQGEDEEGEEEEEEGEEEDPDALEYDFLLLLAPCLQDSTTHHLLYKNFDDEVFASCAEFTFLVPIHNFSSSHPIMTTDSTPHAPPPPQNKKKKNRNMNNLMDGKDPHHDTHPTQNPNIKKSHKNSEDTSWENDHYDQVNVIVLTKQGHCQGITELQKLISFRG